MARFKKSELSKVKPGTWVTLKWPEFGLIQSVLLLEKIDPAIKGYIYLTYFDPSINRVSKAAYHTQIVSVGEELKVPEAQEQYVAREEN